jgi:hypothetical protein
VLRRLAPGRPLVVYVAAAPCRSCLGGARTLSAAARRRPGIAFAAVAAGDAPREAARFFRLARWPGARLLDERGTLAGGLGVRSLPTTLVLSAQRSVVLRIEGAIGAALVVRAALRA